MKLRSPFKETEIAGELTSLVDVVFLLIIFFMLTTSFKRDINSIPLEMPMSTTAVTLRTDDRIVIELDEADGLHLDGEPVTREELFTRLGAVRLKEDQMVLIRGDRKTPFQSVVRVYDILQELGIGRMAHEVKAQ